MRKRPCDSLPLSHGNDESPIVAAGSRSGRFVKVTGTRSRYRRSKAAVYSVVGQ